MLAFITSRLTNRRWRLQFRCRGSRRSSAVAQLFSLATFAHAMKLEYLPDGADVCPLVRIYEFDTAGARRIHDAFCSL
jgi:hypothetical protein